ncbi:Rhomboid-like protein 15 [Diplonema papillatum]|nr:Rhomboid-like protein 15 [Diplonema papillatum]
MQLPASWKSAVQSWWGQLPLVTRGLLGVCVSLWVLEVVGLVTVGRTCFGPYSLLGRWQLWRLITSPFVHVGLLHLLMNMLALVSLLPPLERMHGSTGALTVCLVYAIMAQLIAITPATVFHVAFGVDSVFEWRTCAAGLSGMLFGLLTLETTTDDTGLFHRERQFFCLTIPSRWYPWVLLVVIQAVAPGASFMGHMGGILSAYLIPPLALRPYITALDSAAPDCAKAHASFMPANRAPLAGSSNDNSISSGWAWTAPAATTRAVSRSASPAKSSSHTVVDLNTLSKPAPEPARPQEKAFPGQGRVLGTAE